MQIAEQALKLLRQSQSTQEESKCMSDYANLILEVEQMKSELNRAVDYSSPVYKVKKKRLDIIEKAAHSFYKSYFNMCKYKELYIKSNQEVIQRDIDFMNLIDM
tara:strand:+ start:1480 stop:1791 length:312 start_codon:yes stop_codon:yes gene_type:complete